jgi:crotonobetainyl-CoA:carnitine CoA-transferase CaiB-like acyl-CoA transferase
MTAVLSGVKVLELGTMISGPFAGMLLADLGAEVIKVENPEGGDPYRRYAAGFSAINMNKKSVRLDLRSPAGRKALLRLVETADVLFENFRPGVMERLELGWPALRTANPRLVYCSITGFGTDGPYRDRPAYDTVVQSLSGFLHLLIGPERPWVPGPPIADGVAGLYAAYGILGALVERGRTGRGRRVELSMIDSLVHFANEPFAYFFATGRPPGPATRATVSQSYVFECADGRLIGIHLSNPDKFWQGLLAATGRQDLADDPRFKTYPARTLHHTDLTAALAPVFKGRPRGHWMTALESNDVPFAPVYSAEEVVADPQMRHLGTFFEEAQADASVLRGIRRPVFYDGGRAMPQVPPPALGRDEEAVLRSVGVDAAEIHAASGTGPG